MLKRRWVGLLLVCFLGAACGASTRSENPEIEAVSGTGSGGSSAGAAGVQQGVSGTAGTTSPQGGMPSNGGCAIANSQGKHCVAPDVAWSSWGPGTAGAGGASAGASGAGASGASGGGAGGTSTGGASGADGGGSSGAEGLPAEPPPELCPDAPLGLAVGGGPVPGMLFSRQGRYEDGLCCYAWFVPCG